MWLNVAPFLHLCKSRAQGFLLSENCNDVWSRIRLCLYFLNKKVGF